LKLQRVAAASQARDFMIAGNHYDAVSELSRLLPKNGTVGVPLQLRGIAPFE
jgi:hypothetical protein